METVGGGRVVRAFYQCCSKAGGIDIGTEADNIKVEKVLEELAWKFKERAEKMKQCR